MIYARSTVSSGSQLVLETAAVSGACCPAKRQKFSRKGFAEFLTAWEFGERLGCGIVGAVPPAPDLGHPDIPFSNAIREMARRLNTAPVRFLAA